MFYTHTPQEAQEMLNMSNYWQLLYGGYIMRFFEISSKFTFHESENIYNKMLETQLLLPRNIYSEFIAYVI